MSPTATKICARVTKSPASKGLNTLGLEFITTGFGSAEETPKLSPWQGFVRPSEETGWNRMGSKSWTLVSVFRANLDDKPPGLFGEECAPAGGRPNHPDKRDLKSITDLNAKLLEEIEHFFISYNKVKRKKFKPLGRYGPERARKLVMGRGKCPKKR